MTESNSIELGDDIENTTKTKDEPIDLVIDTSSSLPISDPFIWLTRWIVYCPIVVRSKLSNGKITKRNPIFTIIYLCIAIIITIGECLWYSIPLFYDYGFTLFCIVYTVAMCLVSISKFISMHYFWIHFNFETLRRVSLLNDNIQFDCTTITRKVNIRMKVILGLAIGGIIALIIVKITKILTNDESEWMDWMYLLRSVLYYWMFDVPLFLTQFMLSIYYCKGHIFIHNLDQMIQNEAEVDFERIYDEYKRFRTRFKSSIALLEFLLKCRLAALIAWIWIDITGLTEAENALSAIQSCLYLGLSSLPFIELVFSGSPATTTYHSFKKRIYEIKELSLKLAFFLNYVSEFPFLVKIFAKEISFKNALRITGAFIVVKVLTYLFKLKVA